MVVAIVAATEDKEATAGAEVIEHAASSAQGAVPGRPAVPDATLPSPAVDVTHVDVAVHSNDDYNPVDKVAVEGAVVSAAGPGPMETANAPAAPDHLSVSVRGQSRRRHQDSATATADDGETGAEPAALAPLAIPPDDDGTSAAAPRYSSPGTPPVTRAPDAKDVQTALVITALRGLRGRSRVRAMDEVRPQVPGPLSIPI